MTEQQLTALQGVCARFNVPFDPDMFKPAFDLPVGYVGGWVGDKIYVGCSPDGEISS